MTEEQAKIFENFELKVKLLIDRCDKLKAENKDLQDRIALKDKQLEETKELLREYSSKYDNLKLAKIISTDDEEMKKTRKRLSTLVREIDKCIALLNE